MTSVYRLFTIKDTDCEVNSLHRLR